MSKLKTPREKKEASLEHDCRNAYGENAKSSRKNIPKSKQRSHQKLRRATKQTLVAFGGKTNEDDLNNIEETVLSNEKLNTQKAFRKHPDASLGSVLEYRRTGDWTKKYRQ